MTLFSFNKSIGEALDDPYFEHHLFIIIRSFIFHVYNISQIMVIWSMWAHQQNRILYELR
jgi:hypothetical protein